MERQNQNLKFTSLLSANKSSKTDKNRQFLVYCSSRQENIVSGELPIHFSNCLQKFKKHKCSDQNIETLEEHPNVLTPRNGQKPEKSTKIRKELSKYKKELKQFTESTKDLEDRYTKINSELNEMKQKHNYIIRNRHLSCGDGDICSDSDTNSTEYSLQRKDTQIFERSKSFIKMLIKKQPLNEFNEFNNNLKKEDEDTISVTNYSKSENADRHAQQQSEDKENMGPFYVSSSSDNSVDSEYFALSCMTDDHPKSQHSADVSSLKKTITKLQNESDRFCSIIEKQKTALSNYRSCFVKAKHLVNEQRTEIEQLNSKNLKLEKDASHIIDNLHQKIETTLRDIDQQADKMRGEQTKRNHMMKENYALKERIQVVEAESKQLKTKLDEMCRRKMALMSRLKVAERDMKIFKNYNAALKEEKRKLNDELKKVTEQVNSMENSNKRIMNRQREQTEKQRRQLQKRIFELETKLNRSQNSSKGLIHERDALIAELQSQLNNLVHNFEVSQKHIRVLRRHIYSICGNDNKQTEIYNNLPR